MHKVALVKSTTDSDFLQAGSNSIQALKANIRSQYKQDIILRCMQWTSICLSLSCCYTANSNREARRRHLPVNAVAAIAAHNWEAVGLSVLLNDVTHFSVPHSRPYWQPHTCTCLCNTIYCI